MFTVFGDESYDEKRERVFAVSGVGGKQEEWDELEIAWLKLTEGRAFHSSDCEAGREDFADMKREHRMKLYKDLVSLLISTNMLGYVVVTDLTGFNKIYEDNVDPSKPYHHCFVRVIMHFAEMGFQLIPRDQVNFIFDVNTETNFASGLLYDYMSKTDGWNFGAQLDKLSFTSLKKSVGIQVADLVAREFMKHCDNFLIGPKKYKYPRESFKALSRSLKYRGIYEDGQYWRDFASKIQEIEKQTGITRSGYLQWLKENNVKDNSTNVHRYLIRLDQLKTKGILT